jgi:hypothetical protein
MPEGVHWHARPEQSGISPLCKGTIGRQDRSDLTADLLPMAVPEVRHPIWHLA